jgi:hypothetical protein
MFVQRGKPGLAKAERGSCLRQQGQSSGTKLVAEQSFRRASTCSELVSTAGRIKGREKKGIIYHSKKSINLVVHMEYIVFLRLVVLTLSFVIK